MSLERIAGVEVRLQPLRGGGRRSPWGQLGPMITVVIFAGRAVLPSLRSGSMKRGPEQLDALFAMATSQIVVPPLLACISMVPLLTIFGNVAGIGGMLVANLAASIPPKVYLDSIQQQVVMFDFIGGLWKAVIFGAEIALIVSSRDSTHGAAPPVRATRPPRRWSARSSPCLSPITFSPCRRSRRDAAEQPGRAWCARRISRCASAPAAFCRTSISTCGEARPWRSWGSALGKSTTLRCLIGLQRPTLGKIFLFGRDVNTIKSA